MIRVWRREGSTLTVTEGPEALPVLAGYAPPPSSGEAAAAGAGAGACLWVEVVGPDANEVARLRERLGLHELALEDALADGHPPKWEDFGAYLFVIARTPVDDRRDGTRKVSIFLAGAWVVTMLRAHLPLMDELSARARRDPARALASPDALAHATLDLLASGFEREAEALQERVERVEDEVLHRPRPRAAAALTLLRRRTAALARVARRQRDVCHALAYVSHPAISSALLPWFRDVYDHALRVSDLLDSVREAVASAREAYLAAVNNRLGEVMRVLTVITTLMMPLTLITGVYGMNFEALPGRDHPLGFWLTIAAMLATAGAMLAWFRRRGWI
ncbi:MAG: magnesium/cobalt transporter CorA [Planctomycetes bacterium]|nr:magnesium/cobalt transporter CorA [Planctomycetota bacterium]